MKFAPGKDGSNEPYGKISVVKKRVMKAYWDEAGPGSLLATSPLPSAAARPTGPPPAAGVRPSAGTPQPSKPADKPKRRSAGC